MTTTAQLRGYSRIAVIAAAVCGASCGGDAFVASSEPPGDASAGSGGAAGVGGSGGQADASDDQGGAGGTSGTSGAGGTSGSGGCSDGFKDCNGDLADGCETSIETAEDCGDCGRACSTEHAMPSCAAGECVLGCEPGWRDCDVDVTTGCEVNLKTSLQDCGGCGRVCGDKNAAPQCDDGQCALNCVQGFEDCDGDAATGCEQDVFTDANRCGSCTNVCPSDNGEPACSGGICGIQCAETLR